jgi:hypothetical protein
MTQTVVEVKSAWTSKINWGEAVKVAGAVATWFAVPQEVQHDVLTGIVAIGAVYTWVVRTWFTKSVTPGSV